MKNIIFDQRCAEYRLKNLSVDKWSDKIIDIYNSVLKEVNR